MNYRNFTVKASPEKMVLSEGEAQRYTITAIEVAEKPWRITPINGVEDAAQGIEDMKTKIDNYWEKILKYT